MAVEKTKEIRRGLSYRARLNKAHERRTHLFNYAGEEERTKRQLSDAPYTRWIQHEGAEEASVLPALSQAHAAMLEELRTGVGPTTHHLWSNTEWAGDPVLRLFVRSEDAENAGLQLNGAGTVRVDDTAREELGTLGRGNSIQALSIALRLHQVHTFTHAAATDGSKSEMSYAERKESELDGERESPTA